MRLERGTPRQQLVDEAAELVHVPLLRRTQSAGRRRHGLWRKALLPACLDVPRHKDLVLRVVCVVYFPHLGKVDELQSAVAGGDDVLEANVTMCPAAVVQPGEEPEQLRRQRAEPRLVERDGARGNDREEVAASAPGQDDVEAGGVLEHGTRMEHARQPLPPSLQQREDLVPVLPAVVAVARHLLHRAHVLPKRRAIAKRNKGKEDVIAVGEPIAVLDATNPADGPLRKVRHLRLVVVVHG
mmetsp:Transcript_25557/g.68317  ORF Transcript_25557/g.68317 Transcript_25557/m.68317 type:complete len:241 (+) Transcript_25557:510-1232(+)